MSNYLLGTVAIDCGTQNNTKLTTPGTIITSPNYPNIYEKIGEKVKDCAITIKFPQKVRLTFLAFDLAPDCSHDYMKFFDGPTSRSSQISNTMCGSVVPQPLESSRRTMRIVFHASPSNKTLTHTGFKIMAEAGNNMFYLHLS